MRQLAVTCGQHQPPMTDDTKHTIEQVFFAVDIENPHIKVKTIFIERWLWWGVEMVASLGKMLTHIICFTPTPNRMSYVRTPFVCIKRHRRKISLLIISATISSAV
jgi:hypothetical protein